MPVDIEGMLHELSVELSRLKTLYEQYFIGIEKNPPTVARREVEKKLADLSQQTIGNTALRFRYTSQLHRWRTYSERWEKILREIENGTYHRHRFRAMRKELVTAGEEAVAKTRKTRENLERAAAAARAGVPVPGMNEDDLRALHRRYVEACRTLGDTREVKFENLLASLKKQVPTLLEKNNCQELAFDVAVREGKVVLRAAPKR